MIPLTVSGDRRRDLDLPCAASPRILRGRIEQAGKVSRWFGMFRLGFGAPACLRLYGSVSHEYLRPVSVAVVSVLACPHLSLHCPMHRPRNYILKPRWSEQSGGRRVKRHTKTHDFCASEKATKCSSCSRSGPISKSLRNHLRSAGACGTRSAMHHSQLKFDHGLWVERTWPEQARAELQKQQTAAG